MRAGARRWSGGRGWAARERNSSLLVSARQLQALVRPRLGQWRLLAYHNKATLAKISRSQKASRLASRNPPARSNQPQEVPVIAILTATIASPQAAAATSSDSR